MKKIATFIICLILSVFTSNAQWVTNTALNTLVSDDATYSETIPISAPGLNGATYISWFQGNGNGSYDAMLQLLDVNGYAVWTTPLVVSNNPQSSALYNSDFTTDNAGNAIMAFQDIRNGDLQTVIYKISANGTFLWGSNGIQLHDVNATFEAAPKIAVFNNDDVVVSWSASASSNKWIAWQIISSAGVQLFSNPQTIDSPTVNYSRATPVLINANSFLLVYVQETGNFPGLTSLVFCQQYNTSAVAQWPSAIQVSSYGLGFVAVPIAVTDNAGGCFIGFNSGTPGAPAVNDAFVQRINPAGVPLFGADGIELCNLTGNHKFVKDLFYNSANSTLYTVLKVTDSGQNGAGVYIQAVDFTGNLTLTNNALEVAAISTSSPCEPFTIDNAGNGCVVTYTEGGFNSQTIKAHKVSYTGTLLFNNPIVLSDASSSKSRLTSNSMQGGNQLVVSWEDSRINQGIYAQNMSNDGTLGVITGINNESNNNLIKVSGIYNNQINLMGASNAELIIINAIGQVLMTQNLHGGINQVNLIEPANSVYLYQVKTNNQVFNGKIVVVN